MEQAVILSVNGHAFCAVGPAKKQWRQLGHVLVMILLDPSTRLYFICINIPGAQKGHEGRTREPPIVCEIPTDGRAFIHLSTNFAQWNDIQRDALFGIGFNDGRVADEFMTMIQKALVSNAQNHHRQPSTVNRLSDSQIHAQPNVLSPSTLHKYQNWTIPTSLTQDVSHTGNGNKIDDQATDFPHHKYENFRVPTLGSSGDKAPVAYRYENMFDDSAAIPVRPPKPSSLSHAHDMVAPITSSSGDVLSDIPLPLTNQYQHVQQLDAVDNRYRNVTLQEVEHDVSEELVYQNVADTKNDICSQPNHVLDRQTHVEGFSNISSLPEPVIQAEHVKVAPPLSFSTAKPSQALSPSSLKLSPIPSPRPSQRPLPRPRPRAKLQMISPQSTDMASPSDNDELQSVTIEQKPTLEPLSQRQRSSHQSLQSSPFLNEETPPIIPPRQNSQPGHLLVSNNEESRSRYNTSTRLPTGSMERMREGQLAVAATQKADTLDPRSIGWENEVDCTSEDPFSNAYINVSLDMPVNIGNTFGGVSSPNANDIVQSRERLRGAMIDAAKAKLASQEQEQENIQLELESLKTKKLARDFEKKSELYKRDVKSCIDRLSAYLPDSVRNLYLQAATVNSEIAAVEQQVRTSKAKMQMASSSKASAAARIIADSMARIAKAKAVLTGVKSELEAATDVVLETAIDESSAVNESGLLDDAPPLPQRRLTEKVDMVRLPRSSAANILVKPVRYENMPRGKNT